MIFHADDFVVDSIVFFPPLFPTGTQDLAFVVVGGDDDFSSFSCCWFLRRRLTASKASSTTTTMFFYQNRFFVTPANRVSGHDQEVPPTVSADTVRKVRQPCPWT